MATVTWVCLPFRWKPWSYIPQSITAANTQTSLVLILERGREDTQHLCLSPSRSHSHASKCVRRRKWLSEEFVDALEFHNTAHRTGLCNALFVYRNCRMMNHNHCPCPSSWFLHLAWNEASPAGTMEITTGLWFGVISGPWQGQSACLSIVWSTVHGHVASLKCSSYKWDR